MVVVILPHPFNSAEKFVDLETHGANRGIGDVRVNLCTAKAQLFKDILYIPDISRKFIMGWSMARILKLMIGCP